MFYQKPKGVQEKRGFPNAATDASLQDLDFNQLLVHNPIATFMMRVRGDNWNSQGIYDGDIAVIDRALRPKPNDILAYVLHDEFAMASRSRVPLDAAVWGVVTTVIHQCRPKQLKEA